MERISKPPEIRRQEILDTAMRLFCEKGYESTSMADIANELHVVQGLCYRYFPSKQALFDTAMQQYVEECCSGFVRNIHDRSKSIAERLDFNSALIIKEDETSRYHSFYHKPGNEALHEMLSVKMCRYMIPHVTEELSWLAVKGTIKVDNPELISEFIMYGLLSLFLKPEGPSQNIGYVRKYIDTLLGI